jgi:hypothetical protein
MDALSICGGFMGVALLTLGVVLLWARQCVHMPTAAKNAGAETSIAKPRLLPVRTADLDVTHPFRRPAPPGLSAGLPDWLHQSDASPDEGKEHGSDREAGDSVRSLAVPGKSDAAHRFMAWLSTGLSDGSILVNEARAPVHFVEEGMLLVSPRIFSQWSKSHAKGAAAPADEEGVTDAERARWMQRQVLRARWHLRGNDGGNFRSYCVMRGGSGGSRLSGVLILNPQRFISAVPPANPLLTPFIPEHEVSE